MSVNSHAVKTLVLSLALSLLPAFANALITDDPDADSLWAQLEIEAKELRDNSRFHEAIKRREKAIERAQTFEQNNRWLAESTNNLGLDYLALGDYLKAESLLTEALNMRVLRFGSIHQDVAESYNNMGALYLSLGLKDKGLKAMEKSLDILKKSPEIDSLEYVIALHNLGASFNAVGKREEAKKIFFESLVIKEHLAGELTAEDVPVYLSIAGVFLNEDKPDSAEQYVALADSMLKSGKGATESSRIQLYITQANIYLVRKEMDKAKALYERGAREIAAEIGKSHPDYGQMILMLGMLEFQSPDNLASANKSFRIAYDIFRKSYPPTNSSVAQAASLLLLTYVMQGKAAEAQQIYADLFAEVDSAFGPQSPEMAQLVKNIMEAHIGMGDYQTAERFSRSLQALAETSVETDEGLMAAAMRTQVTAYLKYQMFDEALKSSIRLIEALERTRGKQAQHCLSR